jgi:hypothetical protein
METEWVDFRIIKEAVTMQMVLDHYDITLKKSGHELRGKCPIHRGTNNKHFTANVSKNVFKCFFAQCGAHGNVLDFVAAMERCSVRAAAVKLRDWFKLGESVNSSVHQDRPDDEVIVRHGIYRDEDGAYYELIGTGTDETSSNVRVVYRELFGDFRLRIGPLELVQSTDNSVAFLTLAKVL